MPRASRLEAELSKTFAAEIKLIPGINGVYNVTVDNKLIFSKETSGHFAEPNEIIKLINSLT
ncbi:MAG TPA: hypothetical protein HPP69_01765 [Deltaproteobacteria bacterium]|nr:hypothetical protein [Deltaproteobacteria bacterium]